MKDNLVICIKSSKDFGMGHLFRGINLYNYLNKKCNPILVINSDLQSMDVLNKLNIPFVEYNQSIMGWEKNIINKYNIKVWINDRLETQADHVIEIHKENCKVVSIDDLGEGSKLAELSFYSLPFSIINSSKSLKNKTGIDFLILNSEINKYVRQRLDLNKIIISFGGTDSHDLTSRIYNYLKNSSYVVEVLLGPGVSEKNIQLTNSNVIVHRNVKSLAELFSRFDLAITAGGITPIEANAQGLPCVIIATESHEIINAKFLDDIGCSHYLGFHSEIDENLLKTTVANLNIKKMSQLGIKNIGIDGTRKTGDLILKLIKN